MLNQKYTCLYIVLLAAVAAFLTNLCTDDQGRRIVMGEWGPVENFGVLLYVVAIAVLINYSRYDRPFFVHSAVILTLMAARELDVQTVFTSKNFLNKTFYRHGVDGFASEQVGAMIALALMGLIGLAYLRYVPRLIANLKKGKAFAFSIAVAIVAIPTSLLLDGAYRVLHEELGLPLPFAVKNFMSSFEEYLETAIPIMIVIALLQYGAERRKCGSGQAAGPDSDG